jgi:hypothetical protein
VEASLEQHDRVALRHRAADRAQERVVERVARADLQHVHAGVEGDADLLLIHHLGVDGKAREREASIRMSIDLLSPWKA